MERIQRTKRFIVLIALVLSFLFLHSCCLFPKNIEDDIRGDVINNETIRYGKRVIKYNSNFSIDWELEDSGYSPRDGKYYLQGAFTSNFNKNVDIAFISPEKFKSGSKLYVSGIINETYKEHHDFKCGGESAGWITVDERVYCRTNVYDNETEELLYVNDYQFDVTLENYVDLANKQIFWNVTKSREVYKTRDITSMFQYTNKFKTEYGDNIYYSNFNMKAGRSYELLLIINVDEISNISVLRIYNSTDAENNTITLNKTIIDYYSTLPLKYTIVFGDISKRKLYLILDPEITDDRTWTTQEDFENNTVLTNLSASNDYLELAISADDEMKDDYSRSDSTSLNVGAPSGIVYFHNPPNLGGYTYAYNESANVTSNTYRNREDQTNSYYWESTPGYFGASYNMTGVVKVDVRNFYANRIAGASNYYGSSGAFAGYDLQQKPLETTNRWRAGSADISTAKYALRYAHSWNVNNQLTMSCNGGTSLVVNPAGFVGSDWHGSINNYTMYIDLDNTNFTIYINDVYKGTVTDCTDFPSSINGWSIEFANNDCSRGGTCTMLLYYDSITFTEVDTGFQYTTGKLSDRQEWTPQAGNEFKNISIEVNTTGTQTFQFRYNATNASLDTSEWITFSSNGTNVINLNGTGLDESIYYEIKISDNTSLPKITSYTLYEDISPASLSELNAHMTACMPFDSNFTEEKYDYVGRARGATINASIDTSTYKVGTGSVDFTPDSNSGNCAYPAGFNAGICPDGVNYVDGASFFPEGDVDKSIAYWVQFTTDSNNGHNIMYVAASDSVRFTAVTANPGLYRIVSGGSSTDTNFSKYNDVWYHLVWTYDADANKQILYVNGTKYYNVTKQDSSSTVTNVFLGMSGEAGALWDDFRGYIDEVMFFNKTLSAVEVSLIYDSDSGLTCDTIISGTPSGDSCDTNTWDCSENCDVSDLDAGGNTIYITNSGTITIIGDITNCATSGDRIIRKGTCTIRREGNVQVC